MDLIFEFLILFLFLFTVESVFLRFAIRARLFDKPNERSSHVRRTIRGGGIIYWFAALYFLVLNYPDYLLFFTGLTIVAVVSFIDDLHDVGQLPRLLSHLTAISLLFVALDFFRILPWYSVAAGYILFVGILNAYNFMDGINGITGLYSISVLGALQWINLKVVTFIEPNFIWYPMIASVIFLFFNFRKRALFFAGDVGSISVSFWIVTLILVLMVKTSCIVWLLLLAVYGIDSVFTIIHRLYLKQNIFEAHRMHFYQVLANECNIDHRIISLGYAVLQAIIAVIVIMFYHKFGLVPLCAIILIPLGSAYFLKFRLLKKSVERRA